MLERILHFLKEVPDKYLLIFLFLMLFFTAVNTGAIDQRDLGQLVRDVVIAILAIAGYRRAQTEQPQKTEVNADTLNATVSADLVDFKSSKNDTLSDVEENTDKV